MTDTLKEVRDRFRYVADKKIDTWNIMKAKSGPLEGDCDDFAITVAWKLAGESTLRLLWDLLTFKSVIWHCTALGGGAHAVLWHRGKGWCDNMVPEWRDRTPHKKHFPWLLPFALAKLLLGKVFA